MKFSWILLLSSALMATPNSEPATLFNTKTQEEYVQKKLDEEAPFSSQKLYYLLTTLASHYHKTATTCFVPDSNTRDEMNRFNQMLDEAAAVLAETDHAADCDQHPDYPHSLENTQAEKYYYRDHAMGWLMDLAPELFEKKQFEVEHLNAPRENFSCDEDGEESHYPSCWND